MLLWTALNHKLSNLKKFRYYLRNKVSAQLTGSQELRGSYPGDGNNVYLIKTECSASNVIANHLWLKKKIILVLKKAWSIKNWFRFFDLPIWKIKKIHIPVRFLYTISDAVHEFYARVTIILLNMYFLVSQYRSISGWLEPSRVRRWA